MRKLLVCVAMLSLFSWVVPCGAGITYKETGRINEPWGIDVTVQFLDKEEVVQTTTFRFVNEKEINNDLANRCQRKIANIEHDIANPPKPELTRSEIEEKLKELGHLAEGESFEDLKAKETKAKPQ